MTRCFNCMGVYSEGKKNCPYCGYTPQVTEDDSYYLPRGTLLSEGRYFVGVPINMGGFGIVYKAWDQTLSRIVAIKEYFPGSVAARVPGKSEVFVYSKKRQEEFLKGKQRFLEEARRIAKFNHHPNIVDVYDFFEDNYTAYMVMEYMEGVTYKQYVKMHGGHLDQQLAVIVALALLDALKEVHAQNIIHRDINPNNVFVCNSGVIKLFDFGAARMQESEMSRVLTPGYAPPEQYSSNSEQGPSTDIYAVGATTYFALTGEKPEESSDRIQDDQLRAPNELCPEISTVVNNAVMKAMALKPEHRFQTAEEFHNALLNKKPVPDIRETHRRQKRRQRLLIVSLLVVFLAAGAGLAWAVRTQMTGGSLQATQLEVWLVADGSDMEEAVRTRFENMSRAFSEDYEQVSLDVSVYPVDEYEQRINEAAREGDLPDLFESDLLDSKYDSMLVRLDQTLELLDDRSVYYYLDQYDGLFPDHLQMPLCFQLPVIYIRQDMEDEETFAVNEMDFLIYREAEGEDLLSAYADFLTDQGYDSLPDAAQMFQEGSIYRYYSDTSDYKRLNEALPGQYRIELPDTGESMARFDHIFSVSADGNRGKAAQWLLYYLLSGSAQDILCIQGGEGLPLIRSECDVFFYVYAGELAELESRIPESIGGSSWLKKSMDYRNQWKETNQ